MPKTTPPPNEPLQSFLLKMVGRLKAWNGYREADHAKEYGDAFRGWVETHGRDAVDRAITACREDSGREGCEYLPSVPALKRYLPAPVVKAQRCQRCRDTDGWINLATKGKPEEVARCRHDGTLQFFEGWKG